MDHLPAMGVDNDRSVHSLEYGLMCQDTPEFKQPRIALCSCNQDYPECDLKDALTHITPNNQAVHRWVWIREDYKDALRN